MPSVTMFFAAFVPVAFASSMNGTGIQARSPRRIFILAGRRVGRLVEDHRVGLRHDLALEPGEVRPVEDDEDVDGVALRGDRLGRLRTVQETRRRGSAARRPPP